MGGLPFIWGCQRYQNILEQSVRAAKGELVI